MLCTISKFLSLFENLNDNPPPPPDLPSWKRTLLRHHSARKFQAKPPMRKHLTESRVILEKITAPLPGIGTFLLFALPPLDGTASPRKADLKPCIGIVYTEL